MKNISIICFLNFEFIFLVSSQQYETHILPESVIHGNDALLKCSIPSFVADFVSVAGWIDSEGNQLGQWTRTNTIPGNFVTLGFV